LDPIGSLASFFVNLANTFSSWYTDAVKATIAFLMSSALPSQEDIESDFFRINFGGTIGLALYLVTGISVLLLLLFLLAPRKDHSKKLSRYLGSLIGLVVYAILFFRLYVYVDDLSKGVMQGTLNFITSSPNGTVEKINDLMAVVTPSGVGSVAVLGIFAVIFSWFAAAIAFGIKMVVIIILIAYPLLIVLRPLGSMAVTAFNAANSFLIVAILSPIMMVFAIALPLAARNVIPGADALGLTALITLVCSGGALLSPIILLYVFFRLSSQVFGRIDAQGQMAITSLPALNWDEAQKDMQESRLSSAKDSFRGVIGSALEPGGVKSLIQSIPDTIVHAGAVAASTQVGPMAGMIIEGVHSKVKDTIAHRREIAAENETTFITIERDESRE
jgi:hypothetical protein